jgi:hypothetical protein
MHGGDEAWFLAQMGSAMGRSIPSVCQGWANTKAAYRFFSNIRVSEADILAGHFQSTRGRTATAEGPVLVLHDTTKFSYQRENVDAIGITKAINSGRDKAGRIRAHTVCGILMHSSLAVTIKGLPLGLAAVKFWTRKKFKGTAALKKKINPTRVPIEKKESIRWLENVRQSTSLLGESERCVHVADREGDIYELFCAAREMAITRSPTRWKRSQSRGCIASASGTTTAIPTKLRSRSSIVSFVSCRRSESRNATPRLL